jgi:dihydrofolate reductase
MRKLITTTFVTLDGVMQAPGAPEEDPSSGFEHGGWMYGHWDQVMDEVMNGFMQMPFELLLGRRTYDIFASYWPTAQGNSEVAIPFNATKKYVVSHSPKDLSWSNSSLITYDVIAEIKKLKAMDGPDLWVHGSGNLIQTLLANNLVDVMHIWTVPVIVGEGKRLFEGSVEPNGFKMISSKTSSTGVTIATYEPTGVFATGTMGE